MTLLDHSQQQVVDLPASERALVIARPGHGKTEVVAARLQKLVDVDELTPADEVLVLSFSRAAVAAVRKRIANRGRAAYVKVRTFDSFASRIIFELGVSPAEGFDSRIRQATELLGDEALTIPSVDSLRHVVVDEVQDLVGDRADLVTGLLSRLSAEAGFTALGDPMQAVYDFQLLTSESATSNSDLMKSLAIDLGAKELTLQTDYRAQTAESREIRSIVGEIGQVDEHDRLPLLRASLLGLDGVSVEELEDVIPRWVGRTAILCRTNGQVLTIAGRLGEAGLQVRVRQAAQETTAPAWIAKALADSPTPVVERSHALRLFEEVDDAPDPELAWQLLKRTEGRRRRPHHLDLRELAERIAWGQVAVDLLEDTSTPLIVSTVHRAKGLEFDNVLVLEEAASSADADDPVVARELFVALTRARRRIYALEAPGALRFTYRDPDLHPGRWVRGGHKSFMTLGFEVSPDDIEAQYPAFTAAVSAGRVQARLREGMTPGTCCSGRLNAILTEERRVPIYDIEIDGHPVALTNVEFGAALKRRLDLHSRQRRNRWPLGFTGAMVDSVSTIGGAPQLGRVATDEWPVGRWGLWLGLGVCGIVALDWHGEHGQERDHD